MDFNKAIKILELQPNFTEAELKSAYRRLSRQYHPDHHEGSEEYEEMKRKQQEINAAKDYLKKHKRTKEENIDLKAYKQQKINELDNIASFEFDKYNEMFSGNVKLIIDEIIGMKLLFRLVIANGSKQAVDDIFNQILEDIKEKFKRLKEEYYKENDIDDNDVKETINYDCTLREFYNQLSKIKEKYNKSIKVEKRLEQEIEKYKNYAGYERLELLVDICKHNALYHIKTNNFQNIEQEIANMHQQIEKEVFEVYYALKKKISELEVKISTIADEKIKDEYENIKEHFENGSSFDITKKALKTLEDMIEKYFQLEQKKAKYKENEETINQIYKSLIDRYSEALKSYNIVTDSAIVNSKIQFFKLILQAFIKGCEEFKDLDYFNKFNEITFKNTIVDEKIIKNNFQQLMSKKSNIYIKTTDVYSGDTSSFFLLDEENMIMYKENYIYGTSSRKITKEELETEYISLEKFLELAVFVGEYRRIMSSAIRYLYKTDKLVLYYSSNNKFRITTKKSFSNIASSLPSRPQDTTYFEPFKDKNYVCEMIEKQVREQVEEYKKSQSQTSSTYSPDPRIYGETTYNDTDQYGHNPTGSRRRK